MRFPRLLATVTLLTLITTGALSARGANWRRPEPNPLINSINRCWGFGWSDGYHAYGSRNSWARPDHRARGPVTPQAVRPGAWTAEPGWYLGNPSTIPQLTVPQLDQR